MGKINDLDGGIVLLDWDESVAASWSFRGIISHWNHKHAKAFYVPSHLQSPPPRYSYGAAIQPCEATDVLLPLATLSARNVYYDPGFKSEGATTEIPAIKRWNQFRIRHDALKVWYGIS